MTITLRPRNYWPAAAWSVLIFVACFLPGSSIPTDDWLDRIHFDKFVHAFLYAVLFLLLIRGAGVAGTKQLFLAGVICVGQGFLIECLQGSDLIRERSFDTWDILANAAGALLAAVFTCFRRSVH